MPEPSRSPWLARLRCEGHVLWSLLTLRSFKRGRVVCRTERRSHAVMVNGTFLRVRTVYVGCACGLVFYGVKGED
jgi:hypothetical protein